MDIHILISSITLIALIALIFTHMITLITLLTLGVDADDEEDPDNVHIYYHKKFNEYFSPGDILTPRDHVDELCISYLEGLIWVLKYYYQGCCSWKWFFPRFYAPLASDLARITCENINFELGRPFRPLEQLMGVLPPASAQFLPEGYRPLMLEEKSPIKDLYPDSFEVDMNGHHNAWEGIALIKFIDEKRLLEAMASTDAERLFTKGERARNTRVGIEWMFEFDEKAVEGCKSTIPKYLPDLSVCQCRKTPYTMPAIPTSGMCVCVFLHFISRHF